MANVSIGDALGEGFRLVRHRPLSVLTWGALRTALIAGMFSLMAPFYMTIFGQIAKQAAGGPPPTPDFGSLMAMQSASWLMSLVSMFMSAVVYCAIARAVLFPERRAFAYLRVGMPEIFMFVLIFGGSIVLGIAAVIAILPIALIAGIAFAAHAAAVGVAVVIFGGLALVALFTWVVCRLMLIGPMMVDDGKTHFADAWALTKGHGGTMFVIALLIFVVLMIVELVFGVVFVALGLGFVSQAAGGLQNIQAFFARPPQQWLAAMTPGLIAFAVLSIPFNGVIYAIVSAPWARAYRDLAPPDVAATFA